MSKVRTSATGTGLLTLTRGNKVEKKNGIFAMLLLFVVLLFIDHAPLISKYVKNVKIHNLPKLIFYFYIFSYIDISAVFGNIRSNPA